MEINLYQSKKGELNHSGKNIFYIEYDNAIKPDCLYLCIDEKCDIENIEKKYYELKKIHFIARCFLKNTFYFTGAFFINEYNSLGCIPITEIISNKKCNYDFFCDISYEIIDYKSYIELCEFTGEKKLILIDFIELIKNGGIYNGFLKKENEDKFINVSQLDDL